MRGDGPSGGAAGTPDGTPRTGPVAPELLAEYGDLTLWHTAVDVAREAAAAGRARLHRLSDGYHPFAVLRDGRRHAAHAAARVFARQVGLDPDAAAFRADTAAREAAVAGQLVSSGPVADALLAVAVTTGVSVVALDAGAVDGDPGLRLAVAGERLGRGRSGGGRRAPAVAAGTIVVADRRTPLAPLFADPPPALDAAVARRVRRVVLYAVEVPGAPPMEVSEAVWSAARHLTVR
jgi:hypothetical protein